MSPTKRYREWEYSEGLRWDDLRFPASGINPAGPGTPPAIDGDDGCFLFHASGTDTVGIIAQMPHSWAEGTTISPHIHWCATSAAAGNVLWRLEYQIANVGDTFSGSWTTDDLVAPTSGVAEQQVIGAFTDIPMTGYRISVLMKIRLNRMGSDGADTYGTFAKVYELDIHYQIDSRGSRQLFTK